MDRLTEFTLNAIGECVAILEAYSHIGMNTHFVKFGVIDSRLAGIAKDIGFDVTLLKYTLALFAAYPLSAIMYMLPHATVKNAFSFLVGFVMVQWIYGPDWIHSFIAAAGTYLICALAPRKHMHVIAFVFVMGYMVGAHIYRMYVSYMSGVFDFTGTQMVLTMKLTSFAYNYWDGTYDKRNVFSDRPFADKRVQKVYDDRARFAVTVLPSPLQYFGYVYCFTCVLAGPAFEYAEYARAIDGSTYRKPGDDEVSGRRPSSNTREGLRRLLEGVVCLALHLYLSPSFKVTDQLHADYIAAVGPVTRFLRLIVASWAYRCKYYFAWKVAEGACIVAGFGFQGYTAEGAEVGWRGVENADIWSFETSANVQTLTRHWNKRTQGWLERYTYLRTGRSLLATYFVSAIWHGLYPGFFLMFGFFPVLTSIERLVRAKVNPLLVPGYDGLHPNTYPDTSVAKAYWAISVLCTMGAATYVTQTFTLGSLENCLAALAGHSYVPHLFLLALYAVLELLPTPASAKQVSDRGREGSAGKGQKAD